MQDTRRQTVIIARQCLSYILRNKVGLTYEKAGELLGKNHATIIHSEKTVKNAMEMRDHYYINAMNNWAVIFQEVMPSNAKEMWSVQDRIKSILETTLLNNTSKQELLIALAKNYGDNVVLSD